jgi:hypothetical protein
MGKNVKIEKKIRHNYRKPLIDPSSGGGINWHQNYYNNQNAEKSNHLNCLNFGTLC